MEHACRHAVEEVEYGTQYDIETGGSNVAEQAGMYGQTPAQQVAAGDDIGKIDEFHFCCAY
jgi:hypothetical protein